MKLKRRLLTKQGVNFVWIWMTSITMLFSCKETNVDTFPKPNAPNAIVIMADDLGYGDVGAYNPAVSFTPNIDQLATDGVKFTQGYVTASVCSPTRAGFLAGVYQQEVGMEHLISKKYSTDISEQGMPSELTLLPEYLQQIGYATALVGKWHLGETDEFHPNNHGFDYFYGTRFGLTRYIHADHPDQITSPQTSYVSRGPRRGNSLEENFTPVDNERYLTEEFTDKAINFIDQHKDNKFFLFLSYTAPHTPLQTMREYLEEFEDYPNTDDEKIYFSMIRSLDNEVGKLNQYLEDNGLDENTMVFFISDNGCSSNYRVCTNNSYLKEHKGSFNEGGVRVPFILKWKNQIPSGVVFDGPVISLDIFSTILNLTGKMDKSVLRTYDGIDLVPYLTNSNLTYPDRTFYWKRGENMAIRHGDYKLVKNRFQESFYNLREDPTESNNIIGHNVEMLVKIKEMQESWLKELPPPRWAP